MRLGRNAERLACANRATALDRARQIEPVLAELNRSGMTTREIAAELTARGLTTPRGGRWHPQTVRRVMERVALFSAQSTATINIIESRSLRNPEASEYSWLPRHSLHDIPKNVRLV